MQVASVVFVGSDWSQSLPHVPQLFSSELRLISQPSTALPLQLPCVLSQVMAHWLFEHDGVPPTALHAFPHPPQCEVLLVVFVSHPGDELQSPQPALQLIWQVLLEQ
jgi:hypothetical protein